MLPDDRAVRDFMMGRKRADHDLAALNFDPGKFAHALQVDQMLVAQHARLQREQKLGATGIDRGLVAVLGEKVEHGVQFRRPVMLEGREKHVRPARVVL